MNHNVCYVAIYLFIIIYMHVCNLLFVKIAYNSIQIIISFIFYMQEYVSE